MNLDPFWNCTSSEVDTASIAYTQSEDYDECTV
jgi:hypothetical protein